MKRHIASWLLLAVFVPMMVLSSLHVHETGGAVEDHCVECVNHVPHDGHISSSVISIHNCVLCQFLTLPYLAAAALVLAYVAARAGEKGCHYVPSRSVYVGGTDSARAPPCLS